MRLTAYADKWTVQQGESLSFYVNCDGPGQYSAELVRLIHGDTNPAGPGVKEPPVSSPIEGTYPGRPQRIESGSYGFVPDASALRPGSLTIQCWIWPTMPTKVAGYWKAGPQAIISKGSEGRGYGILLGEDGRVSLRINDQLLTSEHPVRDRAWHFVAGTFDAGTGEATLYVEPELRYALDPEPRAVTGHVPGSIVHDDSPLLFAASPMGLVAAEGAGPHPYREWRVGEHFNGKIESPTLSGKALTRLEIERMKQGVARGADERRAPGPGGELSAWLLAAWDFSAKITTCDIQDAGPYRLDGTLIGLPARGMTGHNWSGTETDWRKAPGEYGAIHFHDDDVDDARWDVDFTLQVSEDLPSAVYAVKLTTGERDEYYVPFFVRPPLGQYHAKIAVIMSTTDYMAYANEHLASDGGSAELLFYRTPIMQKENLFLTEHREYGGAQYDVHSDLSGTHISSRLRPVLNLQPKYDSWLTQAPWQFNADLHLIDWLTEMGYEFDVITDEDISYDGLARIEGYNVLLTGSHPEHKDGHYLDAIHAYKERGGRFMYMGGDGFYWRQTFHGSYPRGAVTELRRCESGIRGWSADPGEYHHQSDGQLGGMWRFVGRSLHAVAGTGMAAQGFDISTYYKRTVESEDPRVSWAFEGVDYDERIGDFGLVGGGAAGAEVDTIDTTLGSPPHTLLVATSAGLHTDAYLLVTELFGVNAAGLNGTQHPRVRADMAFHETPGGGGVFAFSSIAYCGSLSYNDYENNVSRITANVLNRFMQDGPLPASEQNDVGPRGRLASDTSLNYSSILGE